MTAQEYIQSEVRALAETTPQEFVDDSSLEEAIFAKVMSKKFRKLKADDEAIAATKVAIHHAVEHAEPVKLGLLFGGNKLWRLDEAPEVDWAELFNLIYYLRWMKSIASVYRHGASFEYYSQDIAVVRLNNLSRAETERYSETFNAMLDWVKPFIPKNVHVVYRRHADEYIDRSEYDRDMEEAKQVVLNRNKGKLPVLSEAQRAATELNVRLLPGQSDDPEWREKVELEHQAIFENKTLVPYLTNSTVIPTCPTPFDGLIATGSTKKSIAKFWAGAGALEKSGDSYNELVLTPKQLTSAQFDWEVVNIEGLTGKNFSKIRILQ
jgi:hypothetical protein